MNDAPTVYANFASRTGRSGAVRSAPGDEPEEVALVARFAASCHRRRPSTQHHLVVAEDERFGSIRKLWLEALRLVCVEGLMRDVRKVVLAAWKEARQAPSRAPARESRVGAPLTQPRVADEAEVTKMVGELFPHWVMAELNDSAREDRRKALLPVVDPASNMVRRRRVVVDLDAERSVRLPSDVTGSEIRGQLVGFDTGSSGWASALVRPAGDDQQTVSVPWDRLELDGPISDLPAYCPDVLIPAGEENRDRASSVLVYQRCLSVFAGDKRISKQCAMHVTQTTTTWRSRLAAATAVAMKAVDPHHERGSMVVQIPVEGVKGGSLTLDHTVSCMRLGHPSGEEGDPGHGIVELQCGGIRLPLIQRSYARLRALYRGDHTQEEETADNVDCFHRSVLCMLLRYHALSGGAASDCDRASGLHASVHPAFANALAQQFDVDCDAFANPLNTTQPCFFSLFPDVDAPFGSLGSFFQDASAVLRRASTSSDPVETPPPTALHVNPPFDQASIQRTYDVISRVVRDPTVIKPLTFVVVIPQWSGTKLDQVLADMRKLCVTHCVIPASDAAYVDGHQHRLCCPFFRLDSKTLLFVFQNAAAVECCPAEGTAVEAHTGPPKWSRVAEVIAVWARKSRTALLSGDGTWDGHRRRQRDQ